MSQQQIFQNTGDESTFSRQDSHASRSAWPDSERERKITVTSGRKLSELYVKSGPLGLLARTLLESSRWYSPARRLKWEAITLCSEKMTEKEYCYGKNTSSRPSAVTLNEKVIPSSRILFRLVPSERHTGETECGLLPTVTALDSGGGRINKSLSPGAKARPTIALAAKMGLLPTPNAIEATKYAKTYNPKSQMGSGLTAMACNGMIPCANQSQQTGGKTSQLNPRFVAEMMSFPPDWTELPFLNGDKNP